VQGDAVLCCDKLQRNTNLAEENITANFKAEMTEEGLVALFRA
jgi:hypothetical protein